MSKDNEFEVGKEILSYCGKCKEPTKHEILTLNKNGGADKCKCITCKAKHKYRDPDKPVKKTTKAKKEVISAKALWEEAISTATGAPSAYKMSNVFSEGDLIDHKTFGKGFVTSLSGTTKIRVIFEDGEKVLVHNR